MDHVTCSRHFGIGDLPRYEAGKSSKHPKHPNQDTAEGSQDSASCNYHFQLPAAILSPPVAPRASPVPLTACM